MRGLRVWDSAQQLARELIALAQRNTRRDPARLMGQLCKAANTVGANIAESFGATTKADRLRFLGYALRSAWETRHHTRTLYDCGYCNTKGYYRYLSRATVNIRMIASLIAKVRQERPKRREAW
jgi:four helix bundle protein